MVGRTPFVASAKDRLVPLSFGRYTCQLDRAKQFPDYRENAPLDTYKLDINPPNYRKYGILIYCCQANR